MKEKREKKKLEKLKKPSKFAENVYAKLRQVPKGKVVTYKSLAEAVNTKGFRAIGNVLNKNPYAPEVPCHRVIKTDGTLGGFAQGIEKKIEILISEGIEIKEKTIDLEKYEFKF